MCRVSICRIPSPPVSACTELNKLCFRQVRAPATKQPLGRGTGRWPDSRGGEQSNRAEHEALQRQMRRFGWTLPQAQSSCAGSEGGQSPACEAGTEGGRLLGDTANFSQLCLKVFPRQKRACAMQSCCTCQISTGHPALICVSPSAYIYWLKGMKDINHFFRSQVPICRNLHVILQEISKKSQGYRFILFLRKQIC